MTQKTPMINSDGPDWWLEKSRATYLTGYTGAAFSADEHSLGMPVATQENDVRSRGMLDEFWARQISIYIRIRMRSERGLFALHFFPNRSNSFNLLNAFYNGYLPMLILLPYATLHYYHPN